MTYRLRCNTLTHCTTMLGTCSSFGKDKNYETIHDFIINFILFRSTSIQYRGVSYTTLTWHRNWQKKSLCLKSLFRWLNEVNGQIIQHVFLILKKNYFLTLILIFHHIGKDFKLSCSTLGKWRKVCFKKRQRTQKSISR